MREGGEQFYEELRTHPGEVEFQDLNRGAPKENLQLLLFETVVG